MFLYIDTKTIILLLGLGFIFTFILISAYGFNHKKDITYKSFFLAKGFQTIALFCMVFRGEAPDFLSIFLANSFLFIGTTLEVLALLTIHNNLPAMIKKFYLFLTPISIIGFYFIFILYNNENMRIAYYSFVTVLLLFPVYRLVLEKTSTILMKIIVSLYLLIVIASLVRGLTALLSTTVSTSFYTPGAYQLVSLLSIYLLINLGSIGFILLMKEKVDFELIRLANYDDLTGTLNRRAFIEKTKLYLTNHANKRQHLSYLLFDVDNFKAINDTYGHLIGDQVLQDLSSRIKQLLRKDDLFVRYGGDEFGILLPGLDETESTRMANQIKQMLNTASDTNLAVNYTISIGVLTLIPDFNTQLETLYTTCDMALYQAKRNGRNNIFRGQIGKHQSIS